MSIPFLKELKSIMSSVSKVILKPSSNPDINVIWPIESHSGISLYFNSLVKFSLIARELTKISLYFSLLLTDNN